MSKKKELLSTFLSCIILTFFSTFIVIFCEKIFFNYNESSKKISEIINNCGTIWLVIPLMIIYFGYFCVKKRYLKDKSNILLAFIIIISIISGITFALMTYIMNRIISGNVNLSYDIAFLFFCTLFVYAYTVKIVRQEVTRITNDYMHDKREKIIQKLSKCNYENFERIGREKIRLCFNNDVENISSSISMAVSGITSSIVLICCCIYLAFFKIGLFVTALFVITIVFGLIVLITSLSRIKWNKSREQQDEFYSLFDGFIDGFADLVVKKKKICEYLKDFLSLNDQYSLSRIKAELYFSYSAFATEALIFLFLGGILIVLPILDKSISLKEVSEFFVVFMMLKGHFDVVVNSVPQIPRIMTSYKRINKLNAEIGEANPNNYLEKEIYDNFVKATPHNCKAVKNMV